MEKYLRVGDTFTDNDVIGSDGKPTTMVVTQVIIDMDTLTSRSRIHYNARPIKKIK